MAAERNNPSSERLLAEEVQEATQAEEPHLEKPVGPRSTSFTAELWSSRLLIGITLALVLVVGAAGSLALGSWWILLGALVVHAIGTVLVVGFVLQLSTQVERPAPETVAALEERGVRDPERELNEQVAAAEEQSEADEQRESVTPSRDSRPAR